MAFHRKAPALWALRPDIAIIQECAAPDVMAARGLRVPGPDRLVWMGNNPNKGLAVWVAPGWRLTLGEPFFPTLSYLLPVHVSGPVSFNLLGVWAQNASAGTNRKHQLGPMRRGLTKYADFLGGGPAVISGDLNNNVFWDRPGWRVNHQKAVDRMEALGLTSAYHAWHGLPQGNEPDPTLYWRDRKKDGPTYHIDYTIVPKVWIDAVRDLWFGSFEDWVGAGLSDHVPLVVDLDEGRFGG